jgi:hypothetical protein
MVCLVALSLSVSYAHASPSKENNGVASADKNSGAIVSQIKDTDTGKGVQTSVALNTQLSGNSSKDALAETMKEQVGKQELVVTGTDKTFNLSGLSVLDQVATIDLSNTKVDSTGKKKVVTLSPAAQSTSYVGNDTVSIMFFNTETNDWEVITGDDITVNDDGTITVNFPADVDSSTQFAIVYDADQNLDISVDGILGDDYEGQNTPIDSEQTTPILVGGDSSNGEESTSTTKKSTKSKTGDDTPVVIYAGAGLVALAVVGALVYKGKKHN